MDPLDFAVYRYLSPGGAARFWAGRRVLDPRITPREIAERVGISESSVRTRLHRLAERGFLRDHAVVPNPSLFGRQVFTADLLVKQPGEVDRILRDLALVETVVFTRDILDEDEREIQVHFVSEGAPAAARVAALLARLAPAGRAVLPRPYYVPACEQAPSPLGWRVLQTVSKDPEATFAKIAKSVGISLKTAARSYHRLIDSGACWWTHGPTSEEFPLALVCVNLRSPREREPILGWIGEGGHPWLPVAPDGFGLEPAEATTVLAGLVPADVPTLLERFLRKLAALDGVATIRRTFPLGSASYPAWFANQLSHKVQASP